MDENMSNKKKDFYSLEDVNISVDELYEIITAIQNNEATEKQINKLFGSAENITLIEKDLK